MMMEVECGFCGQITDKPTGRVNSSRARGDAIYCDRKCAGLSRRKHKTKAQKVSEKAEYDRQYRFKNRDTLKAKKAAYFKRTYDPVAAAEYRKSRMHIHLEYCRRPEYKKWKREYDKKYRAKKIYGPFWESSLVLNELETEILSRASRYEIDLANGVLCKTQKRKREYVKSYSRQS